MKSLTIGKKLFGCFGAALALTLLVSCLGLIDIGTFSSDMDRVIGRIALKQYLASNMDTRESDMIAAARGMLLAAFTKDDGIVEKRHQEFADAAAQIKKSLDEYTQLIETDEGRRLVADIGDLGG
jgi:CHASE3 domain sensor protein